MRDRLEELREIVEDLRAKKNDVYLQFTLVRALYLIVGELEANRNVHKNFREVHV